MAGHRLPASRNICAPPGEGKFPDIREGFANLVVIGWLTKTRFARLPLECECGLRRRACRTFHAPLRAIANELHNGLLGFFVRRNLRTRRGTSRRRSECSAR